MYLLTRRQFIGRTAAAALLAPSLSFAADVPRKIKPID
jgi:hypothetical protein